MDAPGDDDSNTSRIIELIAEKRKNTAWERGFCDEIQALYDMLEKRIRDYPMEAKQKDAHGRLPIHHVCCWGAYFYGDRFFSFSNFSCFPGSQPPESLIRTMLQAHPEGAFERSRLGNTPLHTALDSRCSTVFSSSCIHLFSKAFTIPNNSGKTAFHESLLHRQIGLPFPYVWSLLHAHPQSASIPSGGNDGMMPLDIARTCRHYQRPAIILLVKLALYYGAVPQVPAGPDYEIATSILDTVNSDDVADILPLPEGDKDLLLKESIRANCSWVLFDFLFTSFPKQRLPVDTNTGEPRQGSAPFELAVRNLIQRDPQERDCSYFAERPDQRVKRKREQLSMVYSLLRDNPMHYLNPQIEGSNHRRLQEFQEYASRHRRREHE